MGIASSVGIGSGVQIESLVSQLIKAEGQPAFNAIQTQQDALQTRISGIGSFKGGLSAFQSAVKSLSSGEAFTAHKGASKDETLIKATATSSAVAGAYTIEVSQLAKSQKSMTVAEFSSGSAVVGDGTLTFTSATGSNFSLTVGASDTLLSLRDAINGASANFGVSASIINVNGTSGGTVSKLVLTSDKTGADNGFTVSGTDNDGDSDYTTGLARFFSNSSALVNGVSAQDASIIVDGQTATRSSNMISDVINGVTLDLKKAQPGTEVEVKVELDTEAVTKSLNSFVSAYNNLNSVVKSLTSFGGAGKNNNGALFGDSTLRNIMSHIRTDTTGQVTNTSSQFNSLAMIGVKVDQFGVMSVDSSKLNAALTSDSTAVKQVFSAADGVATRLSKTLDNYLQTGGVLYSQETSLNTRLKSLDSRREAVQIRLDKLQKSMLKQFTAMDMAVGQFQTTGTFLTQQFASNSASKK